MENPLNEKIFGILSEILIKINFAHFPQIKILATSPLKTFTSKVIYQYYDGLMMIYGKTTLDATKLQVVLSPSFHEKNVVDCRTCFHQN